jgi:hypothetical protein
VGLLSYFGSGSSRRWAAGAREIKLAQATEAYRTKDALAQLRDSLREQLKEFYGSPERSYSYDTQGRLAGRHFRMRSLCNAAD